MVRTADSALRVTGGKSTRKGNTVTVRQESSSSKSPSGGDKGSGGLNPICPRETPPWQKPITNFFSSVDKSQFHNENGNKGGSSRSVPQDVNMADNNEKHLNEPGTSSANKPFETMDEEFQECRIGKFSNKENSSNSINSTEIINKKTVDTSEDTEMEECDKNVKKRIKDDDTEMLPSKRMKLDNSVFEHLEELEQL